MKYLNRIKNIEKSLPDSKKDLQVIYIESTADEEQADLLEGQGFEILRVEFV